MLPGDSYKFVFSWLGIAYSSALDRLLRCPRSSAYTGPARCRLFKPQEGRIVRSLSSIRLDREGIEEQNVSDLIKPSFPVLKQIYTGQSGEVIPSSRTSQAGRPLSSPAQGSIVSANTASASILIPSPNWVVYAGVSKLPQTQCIPPGGKCLTSSVYNPVEFTTGIL